MNYEVDLKIQESYFSYFQMQFPNRTQRFMAARSYLGSAPLTVNYPSRLALALHWGDNEDRLRELAGNLYGISQAAINFAGQHAIVLTSQHSTEQILSQPTFRGKIRFSLFTIGSECLLYAPNKLPESTDVSLKIGLSATDKLTPVTTDNSTARVGEAKDAPRGVPFYEARLGISSDIAAYEQSRNRAIQRPVIMGDVDCATFLGKLAQINFAEPLEQLATTVALEAA